jgi:hypothetical protein
MTAAFLLGFDARFSYAIGMKKSPDSRRLTTARRVGGMALLTAAAAALALLQTGCSYP